MSKRPGRMSWLVALLLGGLGASIIAYPIVTGLHAFWVAFAVTIGAALLAGAFAIVSPSKSGEPAIFRRGG